MLEVSWFLCGILYYSVGCFLIANVLTNEKFEFNYRNFFLILVSAFCYFLLMKFDLGAIKPFIVNFILFLLMITIYKNNKVKILISLLYILLIFCISELVFDLFVTLILKVDLLPFLKNPLNYLISNFIILCITILISKIKVFRNVIINILNWYNKNETKSLTILSVFALIIFCFPLYNLFIKTLPNSILWFLNLFCIAVLIFIIGYFKEKSNNNRIITEYDQLLEYVKTYEKLIETKSKNQHEYKNQLILIQGMIKNKEARSYIDELLKNEKDDQNIELLKKLQYLPQGGLKGLIYYKIEKMIDKKIDVYVDIASNLKNTKVLKENLQDVSKIIGVYLDNAIEAVESADKKYIVIESYMEDGNIVFSFSNTYKGNINLNKVDKEGYTTKGEGKGYGLPLVKDIIEKNKNFSQKRELNGIYYVQKLYIKK